MSFPKSAVGESFLPRKNKVLFSLGNLGSLMVGYTFATWIFFFYADIVGLAPWLISIGMFIFSFWDAINDPIMGYISDRTWTRWGRRRPYILFGAIPLGIVFTFLWTPPKLPQLMLSVYFISIICIYDLFHTMVILPWFSLYPEMSITTKERVEISTYLQIFGMFGLIFAFVLPPFIVAAGLGYAEMGIIIGTITSVTLLATFFVTKERREFSIGKSLGFTSALSVSLRNFSYLTYLITQFCLQVTYSIMTASLPFFFTHVLRMSEIEIGLSLFAVFASALPALIVWMKSTSKYGAKKTLMISMMIFGGAMSTAFFLTSKILAVIVMLLAGFSLAGPMLLPTVMIGDVIDEDELNTGIRREGMYMGISNFAMKLSTAVSAIAIGATLTIFGYVKGAPTQSATALLGMRILVGLIPPLIMILGILVLSKYPLAGRKLTELKERTIVLHQKKLEKLKEKE